MCLGVARRGHSDEEDWFGERTEFDESYEDIDDEQHDDVNASDTKNEDEETPEFKNEPEMVQVDEESRNRFQEMDDDDEESLNDEFPSLLHWMGMHLMATSCSNKGAVIEWVLVPFIIEETKDGSDAVDATNATNSTRMGNATDGTSNDDTQDKTDESSEDEEL